MHMLANTSPDMQGLGWQSWYHTVLVKSGAQVYEEIYE